MSDILDAFGYVKVSLIGSIAFILSPSIPVLLRIPTARGRLVREFKAETTAIANELMNHGAANSERNELKPLMDKDDKSVIGLLSKFPLGASIKLQCLPSVQTSQVLPDYFSGSSRHKRRGYLSG